MPNEWFFSGSCLCFYPHNNLQLTKDQKCLRPKSLNKLNALRILSTPNKVIQHHKPNFIYKRCLMHLGKGNQRIKPNK